MLCRGCCSVLWQRSRRPGMTSPSAPVLPDWRGSDPARISELRSQREPAQPPGLSGDGPAAKGLMAPTNAPSEGSWAGMGAAPSRT